MPQAELPLEGDVKAYTETKEIKLDTVKQKFVLLTASVLVSFSTASVTATEENTEPTKSSVVIEHFDGNDLSREEISAKIQQSLKARGIDAASMGIDLENLPSGKQKIFIMRTDKDLPLESKIEVYAEHDEFMPLTNEKTLSKKAARCVLNYLPKLSAGDTSWLLREACETLHPKS